DATGRGIVISSKDAKVSSCAPVLCAACQLGKQKRRTPGTEKRGRQPGQEMILRRGNLQPGDMTSIDQYISTFPGRLPHSRGKEPQKQKYNGGTIFVDHASGHIFIYNQVSLRAGETLAAKKAYEHFAQQHGVNVKAYRADNLPFNSARFKEDIQLKHQTIDFSGVGAHHQNGVAERSIATVTNWARTLLLHFVLHWPDAADLELWPFALEMAVYCWNNLPKRETRRAPLEVFARELFPNYAHLRRLHVWGCPVYVLDPKLQDGKKLPKWNPRARRGLYLGPSPHHSTLVSRVLNLNTGAVSPQYHIVCDDLFSTVPNCDFGGTIRPDDFDAEQWSKLIETGYELHLDNIDMNDPNDLRQIPSLSDDWLTGPELRLRHERQAARDARQRLRIQRSIQDAAIGPNPEGNHRHPEVTHHDVETHENEFDPPLDQGNGTDDEFEFDPDDLSVPEGVQVPEERNSLPPPATEEFGRGRRTRKPNSRYFNDRFTQLASVPTTRLQDRNPKKTSGKYFSTKKIRAETFNKQFFSMLQWGKTISMLQSPEFATLWSLIDQDRDPETQLFEMLSPLMLQARANAEDNPGWEEAMNGPFSEGFWEAAKKEIDTLLKMDVWDVVDREPWMNVIPSTWAFKIKRLPDGSIQKFKGRFCCRGDRQVEGIDYQDDELFSPVVSWNTVRLLLILSCILGLTTKQVDYTAAFVHAPLKEKENIFVQMPRGFSEPGKVLKLNKCLYGLKQSPRNFYQFLTKNLEAAGFTCCRDVDPCLFISEKCICLVYVDDTLFFSPKEGFILEAIEKLQGQGMEMTIEDSVAGFLGVHIDRDESNGTIKLTQKGLIKRIMSALEISSLPIKHTPAIADPLTKDEDGDPPDGTYSYPSVIGMILYLSGHSRPDIAFAVSQCGRFIHCTKRSHELALERIGQYLKGTMEEGLILKPNGSFDIECHVDADFAGLWPSEDIMDPSCVKSRTGFVISISGCPIVWTSRLQSDIAGSTMEAEYNALSMAMKDVIPIQTLFSTVGKGVGLSDDLATTFKTTVWEDNMGCLRLARMEPGQYTPRSKHYAVKYHWFRSKLHETRTTIQHITTDQQKADILTKGLRTTKFREIRKILCGW
ncbi:MAG: hypothetical protein IBX70_14070, partial [Clostridia bacterium]|nr:hypothetical protein [Clostridia bacterium]